MLTRVEWAELPRARHLGVLDDRPGAEPAHVGGEHGAVRPVRRAAGARPRPHVVPRADGVLRSLVLLPLVLPPVVGGIALLYTFGRRGLLGRDASRCSASADRLLDDRGGPRADLRRAALPRRQPGGCAAHGRAAVRGGRRDARGPPDARCSCASPCRSSCPGWPPARCSPSPARSASSAPRITFAGSLQGVTRTLPLEIYLQRETDPQAAVALSLVLSSSRPSSSASPGARGRAL